MRMRLSICCCIALAISLGQSSVWSQDITTGLIGHWKLDEDFGATTAVDSVGGRNGTLQGAVTPGLSARVDNGYTFAGSNGNRVLTTADATNLGLNAGPFSMFAFVKTSDIGTVQQHIISGNNGAAGRWNLGVLDLSNGDAGSSEPPGGDGSGELFFFHNGGVGFKHTDITVSDGLFHLVGLSKDAANNWTGYVDNVSVSLGNSAGALGTSPIAFGERPNAGQFPWEGFIDDVRIYNRVLTATDIQGLLAQPTPPPSPPIWIANVSGLWTAPGNWSTTVPNSNTATAAFRGVITADRTVIVDTPITVRNIEFNNSAASYVVAGTSTLTLDADAGNTSLQGISGAHEFQVAVSLSDNLDANIAADAEVSFNNALNLNGRTVAKTGAGRLNVNNLLNSGTGTVNVSAGVLGGTGEIGGSVNNQSGGSVAPGTSIGQLSIDDNYVQSAGAKLAIELGGATAGSFDVLTVGGSASLSGLVEVSLVDGFTPAANAMFPILTAAGGVTNLGLTASGGFDLVFAANSVSLKFVGSAFTADFNNDGQVDGDDLTTWKGAFGPTAGADADDDGDSDGADFLAWQRQLGSGVPAVASTGTIPEPSTTLLLMTSLTTLVATGRRRMG